MPQRLLVNVYIFNKSHEYGGWILIIFNGNVNIKPNGVIIQDLGHATSVMLHVCWRCLGKKGFKERSTFLQMYSVLLLTILRNSRVSNYYSLNAWIIATIPKIYRVMKIMTIFHKK